MDDRVTAVLDRDHERMRAVGPHTGQLLNVLVRSLEAPTVRELGTSFGYSGIWLAEAARAAGGRVITMELHGYESAHARGMAAEAGLSEAIDFRVDDAVAMIADLEGGLDFVLVDLWKDLYLPCLRAFAPKLNPGAIVVADNVDPGRDEVRDDIEAVRAMPGMGSVPLPVGQGLEVSRFEGGMNGSRPARGRSGSAA